MEIDWIEFEDACDPRSTAHPDHDGGIRFTIAPEGYVIALPNGGLLGTEDQKVLGKMLRLAYYQGKKMGQLMERKDEDETNN